MISQCARYTEVAIKQLNVLVSTHESGQPIPNDQLRTLFTILQAHISYLQAEYAGLIVKSNFDNSTASIFKVLEGNSGAFNERSMSNLHRAAEISGTANRAQQNNNRGSGQFSNYRGARPRGPYRGGNWSSQQQYGSRDVYQNMASRNIPPRRSGNQQSEAHDD